MKLPAIIKVPHPLLRQQLEPVTAFDEQLRQLSQTMLAVMRQADGVGLAANQIGVNARIFVYEIQESFEVDGQQIPAVPATAVVNPIVTTVDQAKDVMEEGCLSLPGIYGPVSRPVRILLEGLDIDGKPIHREVRGYEARVIQHEVDHLNGKLFLDYVTDPTQLRHS